MRPQRNSTVTTIAPTGTISIIAEASGGIEPLFSLAFMRQIMDKDKLLEVNEIFEQVAKAEGFYSAELMEEIAARGHAGAHRGHPRLGASASSSPPATSPRSGMRACRPPSSSTPITPVSKTVNFPPEATEDEVREVYELAYQLGCKGVTIYRDGSRAEQPMATVAKKQAGRRGARHRAALGDRGRCDQRQRQRPHGNGATAIRDARPHPRDRGTRCARPTPSRR